jgi:hypothetical protein
MDGVRVEMGPGEISFGEDQNTRQVDGKRGHLSGTVGPGAGGPDAGAVRDVTDSRIGLPIPVNHGWF